MRSTWWMAAAAAALTGCAGGSGGPSESLADSVAVYLEFADAWSGYRLVITDYDFRVGDAPVPLNADGAHVVPRGARPSLILPDSDGLHGVMYGPDTIAVVIPDTVHPLSDGLGRYHAVVELTPRGLGLVRGEFGEGGPVPTWTLELQDRDGLDEVVPDTLRYEATKLCKINPTCVPTLPLGLLVPPPWTPSWSPGARIGSVTFELPSDQWGATSGYRIILLVVLHDRTTRYRVQCLDYGAEFPDPTVCTMTADPLLRATGGIGPLRDDAPVAWTGASPYSVTASAQFARRPAAAGTCRSSSTMSL